jgi:hypothetical protein
MEKNDKSLRHWLDWQLSGGGAHATFDDAVRGLPPKLRGARAANLPHTAWQLLEHMRLAQWDILDFSRNRKYKSMPWPEDYWPKTEAPASGAWDKSVRQFRADLAAMCKLVKDSKTDLYAPIPWGDGRPQRLSLGTIDPGATRAGLVEVIGTATTEQQRRVVSWKF